jgi:hypothetical protein
VTGLTFVIDGANWQRRGLKMPVGGADPGAAAEAAAALSVTSGNGRRIRWALREPSGLVLLTPAKTRCFSA